MKDIYTQISKVMENGQQAVLVTVTEVKGSGPRHAGSKMLVFSDGSIQGTIGGGKMEKEVIEKAQKVMGQNSIFTESYSLTEDEGMLCGGKAEVLFESIGKEEKLLIFGAGHIGQSMAPMAKQLGFHITILDNREEYATSNRFEQADQVISGPYQEIVKQVQFTEHTYVLIVTHGHTHDEEVLEYCIQQPFNYLGMIGSKNKSRTVLKHLKEKGISQDLLDRVQTPVGINIGSETPAEIAISILAEMVAVRRGKDVQHLSMKLQKQPVS